MSPRNEIIAERRAPGLVRCRLGGGRLVAMLMVSCLIGPILSGCAVHKQVQYFAATDPKTGATNYYRMTITGSGGFGTDYHLQAGYFSAAAVDMLRGAMPDIPGLDMDIEHEEAFRRLTSKFRANLLQECKAIARITDAEGRYLLTLDLRRTAQKAVQETKRKKRDAEEAKQRNDDELAASTQLKEETADAVTGARNQLAELERATERDENQIANAKKVLAAEEKKQTDAGNRMQAAEDARGQIKGRLENINSELKGHEGHLERAETLMGELWEIFATDIKTRKPESRLSAVKAKSVKAMDSQAKTLARLIWYASLSDSDLISIGMTQNTNPFQFRKLVFWATASNIDLNEYATEIDAILDNVTGIASSYRELRKQRKKARKSRRSSFETLINNIGPLKNNSEFLKALFDVVQPPETEGDANEESGGTP